MDASTIQLRQDTFVTSTSSQRAKSSENNESAVDLSDNDQDDSSKVYDETVKLSDTSLKLSTSSPVQSSDKSAPIENEDQARQAISQLIADFQSNPSQAQGAHNKIFSSAVKSLLG